MNLAVRASPMTLAEFLAWEDRQPSRYEFDGVRPVAMTGGTAAHALVQRNLAFVMTGRLRGKPCRFYGSDLKIEVAGRIRYPDGFVSCTPVAPQAKVVRDPVVIFEVTSESTEHVDMFAKNREYAETPSVRRYLMLSQREVGVTMFERAGTDWVGRLLGPGAVVEMPEIGLSVPLDEFYEDVEFVAEDATSASSP